MREHRLAEAVERVPQRPGARGEAAGERLQLSPADRLDVALEQDVAGEDDAREGQRRAQGEQDGRAQDERRVAFARLDHRHFSLRAANPLICRSSHPWLKREMFVSP